MFELLVFGTFWFWVVCIIATCVVIAALENDSPGGAFVTLAITVIVCYILGSGSTWGIIGLILTSPKTMVLLILGYFVAGTIWSFVKWYFFLLDKKDEYLEAVDMNTGRAIRVSEYKPEVRRYKGKIISWMCYWPFSLLWSLVGDFLKRAFRSILEWTQGIMQKMSDHVFSPFKNPN